MAFEVSQNKVVTSIPPVSITVDTLQELEWLYQAISEAVHSRNVQEDSLQQEFYSQAQADLNEMCAKYRHLARR